MPAYADSARYSQVAHDAQLAHYGLPTGGVPKPHMSRPDEYKGSSQRKPVQTGTVRNQDGPYPSMVSTPSRKPVGGYRTVSSASTHLQSPTPAKSSGHAGYNKPLPPTPGTPAIPSVDSRRGSSSGWSFSRRKRTDSNATNATGASTTQRSRTGSFGSITEAAKKTGKWLAKKVDIVAMPPNQREALFEAARRQNERETELKRQRGEISRPDYQKQCLTQQSLGIEAVNVTFAEASYQAQKEHEAARQRRAALYRQHHEKDCAKVFWRGGHRPDTPEGAKLSPPQRRDSLTPSMNDAAQARFDGIDPEAKRPLPSKSDYYAKKLSEALDGFKRKGSNASSMWVSDTAPTGTMDYCGKCGKAPQKVLQHDMCEGCVQRKYFEPQITSMMTRKRGHNPKSPEDDAKGGYLYMRLPTQQRLRKVRETMYEDPGNPFDIKIFEDPLLPSTAYLEDTRWETDNSETWILPDQEAAPISSSRAEREILSVFSDPFDLVDTHSNRETWSSFGSNRRSMSVDIGFLPIQSMMTRHRSSDYEPSWPLRVPTLHIQQPTGTPFTLDTKRDSRFYDFYDDLLAEYETE